MKNLRERKVLFALLAMVLIFAGCKGESPTAPPVVSGPGGSGTPPVGVTIVLTAVNPTPFAGSSTEIRATVSQNNAAVPNGTAVEFSTTLGVFSDTGSSTSIRTTTGGVATATLTSSSSGTATVRAVVNNVVQTITVTFQTVTTVPPPTTPTNPVITSVTPLFAPPTGGTLVTIKGRNFRPPVKVFMDFGQGNLREAQVTSVTSEQIQFLTPLIDLGVGQTATATILVFTEQGLPTETALTVTTPFTFQKAVLTPIIRSASPASGGIDGGTRVTLFGEGFESLAQVFFGSAEASIVRIEFSQIIVTAPVARDTNPDGSGAVTGPVDIRVINITSGTSATLSAGFRYISKMEITAAGPTAGTALGGTRVTIDGNGFDQPVVVSIGGFAAQPVFVSATRVIAVTSPTATPCGGTTGPIVVLNRDNGDQATGPTFTYIGVDPIILRVTSAGPITPGSSVTVDVLNPGIGVLGSAVVRFGVGTRTVVPSPTVITGGTGTQTFTLAIPTTGFTFPIVACTIAGQPGTQLGPIDVDLVFNNITTGCSDTLPAGLHIDPLPPNACLTPPSPTVTANPNLAGCANPPTASITTTGFPRTTTATITVSNAANAQPLNVTGFTISGPAAADFSVLPTSATGIPAGGSQNFTLTFNPTIVSPPPKDGKHRGRHERPNAAGAALRDGDGRTMTTPNSK